jgi:ABC transporter substrate binding protein
VKRREFITLLGGAAAVWPLAARAQEPAKPVVGYLSAGGPGQIMHLLGAFREGMVEMGYVEGQNVKIDYLFAESRYDRLPGLAAQLVQRGVAVIVTGATIPTALAAKAASATTPIVFGVGEDPVKLGLVTTIARPGGNATGVNFMSVELGAKVLGLIRELVPQAIINPRNTGNEAIARDLTAAAPVINAHIDVLHVNDSHEIEAAFATLVRNKADALLIGPERALLRPPYPVGYASRSTRNAHRVSTTRVCGRRRADELRGQSAGSISTDWALHRPYSEGCSTRRSAGDAIGQVRISHQSSERTGPSASKYLRLCSLAPTR